MVYSIIGERLIAPTKVGSAMAVLKSTTIVVLRLTNVSPSIGLILATSKLSVQNVKLVSWPNVAPPSSGKSPDKVTVVVKPGRQAGSG